MRVVQETMADARPPRGTSDGRKGGGNERARSRPYEKLLYTQAERFNNKENEQIIKRVWGALDSRRGAAV